MCIHSTNDCGCNENQPCPPISNNCPVLLSSDCVNNFTEDLTYAGIIKGQTLTEVLVQFDEYINSRFNSVSNYISLINVGNGSQIYKGISTTGKKQIRTLLDSSLINLVESTDDITISVDETVLTSFIENLQSTYSVSNIGVGASIYKDSSIVGDNTQFNLKKLKSSNSSVSITEGADDVDFTINLSGFVPYVGATSDVNLGEFGVQAGNIKFDNSPTNAPITAGSLYWNDSDGTLDLKLKGNNTTLQIGQEQVVRVVNKTGVDILGSSYSAVYISGAQGQRLKVNLASATTETLSSRTVGLATETINNNLEGFITTSGLVRDINTTGSLQGETWVDGSVLYLSPTVLGGLTVVEPVAPYHRVVMGVVVSAHATTGSIFVKIYNGNNIEELHNVRFTSLANNDILYYDSATSLWKNKQITIDGSETKLTQGTNITITGAGTIASPYIINSSGGTSADGSETKINAGSNITITGVGTIASPYIINGLNSPFERVDEGSGLGVFLRHRDVTTFGAIGEDAFDISWSGSTSSTAGATGTNSFAQGYDVTASGSAASAFGDETVAAGDMSFVIGKGSTENGYANFLAGGYNIVEGGAYATVVGQFADNILNNISNVNDGGNTMFAVGNGTATESGTPLARSTAFKVFQSGLLVAPSLSIAEITAEPTGKVLVTKEYLESLENKQKTITYPADFTGTNYTITNADYGYSIIVVNGATAVTVTVPTGLVAKMQVGFIQDGTGDITMTPSGTTLKNAIAGYKIKGQYDQVFLEQGLTAADYYLLGNTKI